MCFKSKIRRATAADAGRIAEIEIFNYRLYFYPIFQSDAFYFDELQVLPAAEALCADANTLFNTYVYDDGAVKGFIRVNGDEVEKLFVEPVLHGQRIGEKLLEFALEEHGVTFLWALEKNTRAIRFYEKHGFHKTNVKKPEEDTTEYLVRMER